MLKWFSKIFGGMSAPSSVAPFTQLEVEGAQKTWLKLPLEAQNSFLKMYESQTSHLAAREFLNSVPGPNGERVVLPDVTVSPSKMLIGSPNPVKPSGLFTDLSHSEGQTPFPHSSAGAATFPAVESQGTSGFVRQMATALDAQTLNPVQPAHVQHTSDAFHVD